MAQLNDLLVMGQSTLLGPVNIKGTVTAEKFVGDGSGLENVSAVEVLTETEFNALTSYTPNTLYCIIN
jgi:hypothetical protein